MKAVRRYSGVFVVLGLLLVRMNSISAQFENFDFEDYDPNTRILSGWSLSFVSPTVIDENNLPFRFPSSGVPSSAYAFIDDAGLYPDFGLGGRYALGFLSSAWTFTQSGEVPIDAKYFEWVGLGNLSMELGVNDQVVPIDFSYDFPDLPTSIFDVRSYARADISAFAGLDVTLDLTVQPIPPQFNGPGVAAYLVVDNFRFAPVPEPSAIAYLLVFGTLSICIYRRRKETA